MDLLQTTIDAVVSSRFPAMSVEGKHILKNMVIRKDLRKGEKLISEGEVSKDIVFVGEGMLRQYYFKNGKDVTEHFSYEASILMCIESLLKQEPSRLIAEAIEPSTVFLLAYDDLQNKMKSFRELNVFYQKVLEYSLIVSQIKADSWRFETAGDRYHLLLKTQPEVIKRAPMAYIASYLLMTPETLSRVRAGEVNR